MGILHGENSHHRGQRSTIRKAELTPSRPSTRITAIASTVLVLQRGSGAADCLRARRGAIAFVDDYNARVTGPSAEANRAGVQGIIDKALAWARRSGAYFEKEKTKIVHFLRRASRTAHRPFLINEKVIRPGSTAKLLGVVLNSQLRSREHIARAATRDLQAALAPKRPGDILLAIARRLFLATVAPRVDYACCIWEHACQTYQNKSFVRARRIGAQAIVGAFRNVARDMAEAEASIPPAQHRQVVGALKFWVNLHTLLE